MRTLLPLLCSLYLSACFAPPVLKAGGDEQLVLDEFPPETELVELEVEEGELLRGVFVPADEGAPLVLHFLESGGSITRGTFGVRSYPVLWHLRDRGLASLVVDYRGVGSSGGERSSRNVRADARAVWNEGLRRVGGDAGRLVLRGSSIGALAIACLLEEGAAPAAAVLVSPVRDETVVENHAKFFYGDLTAIGAEMVFRDPVGVDLVEQLAATNMPLLVMEPSIDLLLPDEEQALVRTAVGEGPNRQVIASEGDHGQAILDAAALLAEEERLYRALFPDQIREGHRIDSQRLAGALERSTVGRNRFVVEWLRGLPQARLEALPDEALAALLDFDDPAGQIDPAELTWKPELDQKPEQIVAAALRFGAHRQSIYRLPAGELGESSRWSFYSPDDGPLPEGSPARLRLPPEDSFRQVVRLWLKSQGVPERLVTGADGQPAMECFAAGAWRPLSWPELPRAVDLEELASELELLRQNREIPGLAAAVVADGELVWAEGFGLADVEQEVAVTADTPFRLASLTKTYAATILLQLVERGELDLDAPVSDFGIDRYSPGVIRVRHLFSHTSHGSPGESYRYNGGRFALLDFVIEQVTGNSFAENLSEVVIEPLGLRNTAADDENLAIALARPYGFDESFQIAEGEYVDYFGSAAGLRASVADVAAFQIALDAGRFLAPETLELAYTPTRNSSGEELPYGLGWFTQRFFGHRMIWHYGHWNCTSTLILKLPDRNLTFIALCNSDGLSRDYPLGRGDVLVSPAARLFLSAGAAP